MLPKFLQVKLLQPKCRDFAVYNKRTSFEPIKPCHSRSYRQDPLITIFEVHLATFARSVWTNVLIALFLLDESILAAFKSHFRLLSIESVEFGIQRVLEGNDITIRMYLCTASSTRFALIILENDDKCVQPGNSLFEGFICNTGLRNELGFTEEIRRLPRIVL
jgi:hypothetical protein